MSWVQIKGLRSTSGLSGISSSKKAKIKNANKKIYQPHLTNEQAKDVIRSFLAGTPQSVLVARTGFSQSCIRSLCNGENRSHLLREVEMEPKPMMGEKK